MKKRPSIPLSHRLKTRLRWILRRLKKHCPPTEPESETNVGPETEAETEAETKPGTETETNGSSPHQTLKQLRTSFRKLLILSLELWRLIRLLIRLIRQSRNGSAKN